jgi:hypothetical protein
MPVTQPETTRASRDKKNEYEKQRNHQSRHLHSSTNDTQRPQLRVKLGMQTIYNRSRIPPQLLEYPRVRAIAAMITRTLPRPSSLALGTLPRNPPYPNRALTPGIRILSLPIRPMQLKSHIMFLASYLRHLLLKLLLPPLHKPHALEICDQRIRRRHIIQVIK